MLRSPSPRAATRLALCLLAFAAAATLAACGGSSSSPSVASASRTTSTTAGGGRFDRTKLAACLKQQGLTLPVRPPGGGRPPANGAPPQGGGGQRFLGRDLSPAQRAKLRAAFQKCGGGRFGGRRFFGARSPAFRAALTKFVACVRQHGYGLPAPNTSGNGPVFDPRKVNRNDPRFLAASRACQRLLQGAGGFGGGPPPPGGGGRAPGA